ncbi:MAG: MJ0042-type zinc finger domain-containing protein [Phycisphaerae bacterium]
MASKTIVKCGSCGARYRVASEMVGRAARCRRCRHRFILAPKRSLDDSVMDWLLDDTEEDAAGASKRPLRHRPPAKAE